MKCLNAILFLIISQVIFGDSIQIKVKQGILEGAIVKSVIGKCYYSFKGIPYARPPIGELRFKAPQAPLHWKGIRDARSHGSVCPQVNLLNNEYTPGSEDCLYLNVYTGCLTPKKLQPVLFYIPGGSFVFGSGNVDVYGPDFLVAKEVVVVTFNYRLDSLGFLATESCEVSGNAGLKDQVAALKWVRDNVRNFGGDPNAVTIMGQSAGGASVSYHLLSPKSKGLFHRAIIMSGVPSCDWAYPYQPVRRSFVLGKLLGLKTKNATELIRFLQTMPYGKLINTTAYIISSEEITDIPIKMQPFTPVIENIDCENTFLTIDPDIALKNGAVNTADIMCGYTSHEALVLIKNYENYLLEPYKRYSELFVPVQIVTHSTSDIILKIADKVINYYFGEKSVSMDNISQFINYASNATFAYNIQKFFRRWPRVGNKYFYKLSSYSGRNYYGQRGEKYDIKGAAHLDDVMYLFDPKSLNLPLNSKEKKIVNMITTVFTNFVKYGNPTPDSSLGVTWPQYDVSTKAYINIAQNLTLDYAPDENDFKFWQSCYEDAKLSD